MENLVDPKLLKWLVCPACRGELKQGREWLRCSGCGLHYPVVDGVPHLIAERATRRPRKPKKDSDV